MGRLWLRLEIVSRQIAAQEEPDEEEDAARAADATPPQVKEA